MCVYVCVHVSVCVRVHVSVSVCAHTCVCVGAHRCACANSRRGEETSTYLFCYSWRPLGYICRSKHIVMEVLLMEAITAVLS